MDFQSFGSARSLRLIAATLRCVWDGQEGRKGDRRPDFFPSLPCETMPLAVVVSPESLSPSPGGGGSAVMGAPSPAPQRPHPTLSTLPLAVWAVVVSLLDGNSVFRLRLCCRGIAAALRNPVVFGAALSESASSASLPVIVPPLLAAHGGNFQRAVAHVTMDIAWHFAGAPLGPVPIDARGEVVREVAVDEHGGRFHRMRRNQSRQQQQQQHQGPITPQRAPSAARERDGQPTASSPPPLCCSDAAALTVLPESAAAAFNVSPGGQAVRAALPVSPRASAIGSGAVPLHGRWLRLRATGPGLPVSGTVPAFALHGTPRRRSRHDLTLRLSGVQRAFVGVCSDRFDPASSPTAERWTYASNGTISQGCPGAEALFDSVPFADCVMRIRLDLERGFVSFSGGDLENVGVDGLRLRSSRGGEGAGETEGLGSHAGGELRGERVELALPRGAHDSGSPRRFYFILGVFFTRNSHHRPTVAEIMKYDRH
jgi:hypothetical protein